MAGDVLGGSGGGGISPGDYAPLRVDGNAAGVSLTGTPAANATALTTLLESALEAAAAEVGVVIVELTPGRYQIGGSLDQADDYNCLVRIPQHPFDEPQVSLVIRPKGGSVPSPHPYWGGDGQVTFESTFTGGVYSAGLGWPSMFGARAYKKGMAAPTSSTATNLTLTFQGVRFRQPVNPSLCAVDASYVDRREFHDCVWDTTEEVSATGHYDTEPTNPTGIAELPPFNGLDGNVWRGTCEVVAHYAGPTIGELMVNSGVIFSLENRTALNLPYEGFSHLADIGMVLAVRCPTTVGCVDPAVGVGSVPAGAQPITLTGRVSRERVPVGHPGTTWQTFVRDLDDANNKLRGHLGFLATVAGSGALSEQLTRSGGANLLTTDLFTSGWTAATLENGWVDFALAGYPVPGYRRLADGTVHLRGTVKNGTGTAGTIVLTLPAGYRPAGKGIYLSASGGTASVPVGLLVEPSGAVSITSTLVDTTLLALDGVRFPAL